MNMLYLYLGLGLVLVAALTLVYVFHRQIRPHLPAEKAKPSGQAIVSAPVLTPPTAAALEAQLKLAYERQITTASEQLGVDLKATSGRLSEQVERLTTSVIEEELEGYQKTLEEVRKVATETMEQIHHAVDEQRATLQAKLEEELAEERARAVEQFDIRMADIVTAYITESLGGGIDLGAQMEYITTTLEANKEALKKDLLGDV